MDKPDLILELPPIKESQHDYDAIEREIKAVFKREIYIPLLREFGGTSRTIHNAKYDLRAAIHNAKYDLRAAIQSGRIQFSRGTFSGKFNSVITQELRELGAKWDRKSSTYKIPLADLPDDVRMAISASSVRFDEKLKRIDEQLRKILPEQISEKLKISHLFDSALFKVEKEFSKSIKGITVAPVVTKERRKRLADEWQNNMDLWIQKFTAEEIVELRGKMQKTVFAGNRYESAVKTIQKSYGVTADKAKFLARQETNLLMTKYKQTRYEEAGVNHYKWFSVTGSAAHPVRPRHKALAEASKKGKIFKWDDPPVTSEPGEAERHNNPGQDFNCRCFAKPVLKVRAK